MDLQVNGYAGVDFNDEAMTADALDHALHAMLAAGVTACLPTVITAPAAVLEGRLHALDEAVARSRLGPLMVPGYHLEGPFLNPGPGFRGCHPPAAMLPPDPALVERWDTGLRRPVLMMTLAAELDGAEALIRWLARRGKIAAIGHSDAGATVVARAADAGARMSTHLGNGLPGTLPKLDNPLMAQLAEDRLAASFIADGIHLPRPALRAMIRAKGPGRAILVTDAVAAAGAPPGRYGFAGMTIDGDPDGSVGWMKRLSWRPRHRRRCSARRWRRMGSSCRVASFTGSWTTMQVRLGRASIKSKPPEACCLNISGRIYHYSALFRKVVCLRHLAGWPGKADPYATH